MTQGTMVTGIFCVLYGFLEMKQPINTHELSGLYYGISHDGVRCDRGTSLPIP